MKMLNLAAAATLGLVAVTALGASACAPAQARPALQSSDPSRGDLLNSPRIVVNAARGVTPFHRRGQCQDPDPGATARENARPGSSAWAKQARPLTASGYTDRDSVICGGAVRVFVSTSAPSYRIQAWRLGYYNGAGARLIWTSPAATGRRQRPARRDPGTNTVRANWVATSTLTTSHAWPAGQYLLRIVPSTAPNAGGYIPLTVRDPQARPQAVMVLATATYQAYNNWGGYSAYLGPGRTTKAAAANRSRVVTFDRPYAGRGDGQLLRNDYPLLRWLEYKGIDTGYVTTEDVDAGALELGSAAVVVSGTHSEYVSAGARAALEQVSRRGGNLAFFGANQVYWRPRYAATATGPRRDLVIYRYATEDPEGADPAAASVRWRDAPINQPEAALLGSMYDCLGNHLDQPLVVTNPNSWLFVGTGLRRGARLPHLLVGEIDRTWDSPAQGAVVDLNRTWFPCPTRGGTSRHDLVVRATIGGGAVFNAGTFGWVCHLAASCATDPGDRVLQRVVDQMTSNVLAPMLAGPANRLAAGAALPSEPPTDGPASAAPQPGDATVAVPPVPSLLPGPAAGQMRRGGALMVPSPFLGLDDDD